MGHYLVTGGAGFIGSHIVEGLVAQGHRVTVLDNLCTGHKRNLSAVESRIEFIQGDAGDATVLSRILKGVDGIFHQGAIPSVPRSVKEPLECQRSGEVTTLTLLKCAVEAGVKRVVYAGSSSVYGDTPTLPKQEDMKPNPMSPYAVSKLAGECYLSVFARCYPIDTATLRYFNIFGPRQDPNSPYSGVMAIFLTKMKKGEAPVIYGDGLQSRDFTYVENAVQANLKAMFCAQPLGGAVMNIATGVQVTLRDVVNEFNTILGTKLEPQFTNPRTADVRHSLADLTRARTLIGYEPTVGWQEGLRRLAAAES